MIYLASPYSHPLTAVRQRRFEIAVSVCARLLSEGLIVYSPIVHNHSIAVLAGLKCGWDFWMKHDTAMLTKADEFYVLRIEGWDISTGVKAETEIAKAQKKPITYIDEP